MYRKLLRLALTLLVLLVTPMLALALPHEDFANGLESFDARFEQTVFDENDNPIETSIGTVALSKPNLFRWHYEEPFEQIIVADGVKVWLYDIDLEQVTVKAQDDAEAQSPLAMLTDLTALDEQYEVVARESATESSRELEYVRLTPKYGEGELEFIDLGFNDNVLTALVIKDGFGQRTEVRFTEQCRNRELAAALFRFVPPAGVDVVGEVDTAQTFSIPTASDAEQ